MKVSTALHPRALWELSSKNKVNLIVTLGKLSIDIILLYRKSHIPSGPSNEPHGVLFCFVLLAVSFIHLPTVYLWFADSTSPSPH